MMIILGHGHSEILEDEQTLSHSLSIGSNSSWVQDTSFFNIERDSLMLCQVLLAGRWTATKSGLPVLPPTASPPSLWTTYSYKYNFYSLFAFWSCISESWVSGESYQLRLIIPRGFQLSAVWFERKSTVLDPGKCALFGRGVWKGGGIFQSTTPVVLAFANHFRIWFVLRTHVYGNTELKQYRPTSSPKKMILTSLSAHQSMIKWTGYSFWLQILLPPPPFCVALAAVELTL